MGTCYVPDRYYLLIIERYDTVGTNDGFMLSFLHGVLINENF